MRKQRRLKPDAKRSRLYPRIEKSVKEQIAQFCSEKGIKINDFAREALISHLHQQNKTPAA